MMSSLEDILAFYEIQIQAHESCLQLTENGRNKGVVIYPYMTMPLRSQGTVYISDYMLKYGKPYVLKQILSAFQ